jgi:acetyl esterase
MPLDPEVVLYLEQARELGVRPVEELTPAEARAQAEATASDLFGTADEVASVTDVEIEGVPVRRYLPSASGKGGLPLVVYFHGGGWVACSVKTHDGVCRTLASRVPCEVLSVGYRLAPEHRFPAAAEDAWSVTRWACGQGRPVAVAGDSAGGNLAAVSALRARDAGLPLIYQLLIYPVTDYRFDTASYATNASGFNLTQAAMRWYWGHYLGDADGSHPDASPMRAADLSGAAPALVVVCEYDPLRDEGVAYAARLREAGVPVRVSEYEGMIHGFVRLGTVTQRTRALLDESSAALREAFSGPLPAR